MRTHGSLGIIRSLGRLGIPVYGVDSEPRGPAAHSRYLRHRFIFDLATASPAGTVDYLLEMGKAIGSRTVLIPTWDETSLLVADAYEQLRDRFLLPQQPEKLVWSLSSKKAMYFIAKRDGVATADG
jgi:D-aspartate ligase